MKLYVIKDKETGAYQTPPMDYTPDIREADLFLNYELAKAYCNRCCEIVEVVLMETKELDKHEKAIKKTICNMVRNYDINTNKQTTSYTDYVIGLNKCLDHIIEISRKERGD